MNIKIAYHRTKYGELIIGSYQDKLCLCDWRYRKMRESVDKRIKTYLDTEFELQTTEIIIETIKQLDEYFEQKRKVFDLPLLLVGTSFQKKVWGALLQIPYGKTSTYLKQSENLGNAKAIRAVATANGANAIAIIVPCHRIIGSDGKLIGYAGGLRIKEKLLELEHNLYPKNLFDY